MKRRRYLATLAGSVGGLAGCSTRSDFGQDAVTESTPPPDVTTITERKPLPTPPAASSSATARSFVATYERRSVYNDLVDGFGGSRPAISVDVASPRVTVVHSTDRGDYLLSSCTGSAQYYDSDGSPGSMTRNASSVAHFVGSNVHRRVPFNAYRCRKPAVTATTEQDDASTARFQIYDFDAPVDDDQSEEGGHRLEVTVTDAAGSTVLDQRYRTSLSLTVQPRVTDTAGSYALEAELGTGERVQYDWTLPESVEESWWALAVIITNAGNLTVQTLYPNEAVGLPRSTLCKRSVDE